MSLLVALTKALEAARISSTRPASVPSAEEHAAIINQLDVSRLSLCKAINECESLLANKEAELANLREETRLLEECDPAVEHANELDSTVCGSPVLISYKLSHAQIQSSHATIQGIGLRTNTRQRPAAFQDARP